MARAERAYKRGKPRKNVAAPRALEHGFLKAARDDGQARKAVTKGHEAFKQSNLELLASEQTGMVVEGRVPEMYQAKVVEGAENGLDPVARAQYAALETRKEIAAVQLGMGATFEEAAGAAGVGTETVKRYLENRDFRARVEELRGIVRNKVAGRIEGWMDRVTADPDALDQRDPKVILGIYDRISGPVGRSAPAHVEQNNLTVNNYSDLMGRLARVAGQPPSEAAQHVDDATAQGGAFPLVGSDGDPVAG